jgi:hypothetical protein
MQFAEYISRPRNFGIYLDYILLSLVGAVILVGWGRRYFYRRPRRTTALVRSVAYRQVPYTGQSLGMILVRFTVSVVYSHLRVIDAVTGTI